MKVKRGVMKLTMNSENGTMHTKFRLLALVCFSLTVSLICIGCFEETQVLVLNKDGSGHYESVIRFNPQMSVFIEMAEKVTAVKGWPPGNESPFGMVLPNLETSIRAKVEQIAGARLLHLETTHFGEQNEQTQISFALDFDDINTFLASPLGIKDLGLRLSQDDDGNLHLKGTPSPLANIPPAWGGMPSLGMMISQMKSEFGVAGDPEFDPLFRRLLNSPRSTLTFVAPTPIKQTNGALVEGNKVEWKVDIIDAAGAPGGNLYEVVLEGTELEFDVREMPQPVRTMPSPGPPQSPMPVAKPFDGEATIQPLGIQIGVTVPNLSEPEEWKRIRPFWGPGGGDGTTASLLVTIPSGGIVSIDDRASAVTQFSDDTGKDLLVGERARRFGPGSPVQKMDIRGANREYATVFVSAPGRPADDATSLSVAGNIAIVRGGRTETYEQSDIALDEEQTFTLGELSYQWSPNTFDPGMVSIGRDGQNLMFGTMTIQGGQAAHDAVIQTQFFSETDVPINARQSGRSSRSEGNHRTVEKPYGFPRGTKTVKMVVTSMTDRELVTIPFEMTLGLNGSGFSTEVSDISVQRLPDVPAPPPPPPGRPPVPLVGQSAPAFTLTDLQGESVSLSDFKGKVVLLDFWATWCPPCVKEMPHFIELHRQYKDQGFEMVGISVDKEGADVVKPFVEGHGVNYPILMDDRGVAQRYGGVSSIPTAFLIDKEGKIQKQYVGYREKSVFEEDIKALLGGELQLPSSASRASDPTTTGTARGKIVDTTTAQNPVPDVRVVIVGTDGSEYETKTDSQGEYEISGLPPGRYLISVYKQGYRERVGKPVTVIAGGDHYVALKMAAR